MHSEDRPRHERHGRAGIERAGCARESDLKNKCGRFARSTTIFLTPHGEFLLASRLLHNAISRVDPPLLFSTLLGAATSRWFQVCEVNGSIALLYIDHKLVHEVTLSRASCWQTMWSGAPTAP